MHLSVVCWWWWSHRRGGGMRERFCVMSKDPPLTLRWRVWRILDRSVLRGRVRDVGSSGCCGSFRGP